MKNSKKLVVFTFLAATALNSCIEDKDLSQISEKPETYSEVTFSIDGECNTTEVPMRAVASDKKDIYGITISQWVKDASGRPQSKPYAYGIFDDVSNLKVNLLDGYKYRVACTMVRNAVDSLKTTDNNSLTRPFTLDKNGIVYGKAENKFIVADQPDGTQKFLFDADNSKIETPTQQNITRPYIMRYHGGLDSIETNTTGNQLELYRRYFAVKFVANGLRENCRLEVQLDDSPKWILTPGKNETDYTCVSFKTLTGKITTGTILTDNAVFKVELFKDDKSEGVEIMKYNRSFKRNYKSAIVISDIDNFGTDAGLSIKIADEGELENDPTTDLPWQGEGK